MFIYQNNESIDLKIEWTNTMRKVDCIVKADFIGKADSIGESDSMDRSNCVGIVCLLLGFRVTNGVVC